MIEGEQSRQIHQEGTRDMILTNPAFIRFVGGFELYQNLLHTEGAEDTNAITERMVDLYVSRLSGSSEETQQSKAKQELYQIINSSLQECQENNFSRDSFADRLATSPIANLLLTEWNRKRDEVEEGSGMVHVNDVIAYKKDNNNEISLHIRPTGVESAELISKIIDGFQSIGAKLEAGEITADKIVMKSWLLNQKMEAKARMLLGDEISIQDISPEDSDVTAVQHLALQYNKRSLEKYLTTGEKPEVRQVVMTRDEFVARFKKV
ncbi:MAG: hypothetical protein WC928_00370 [Patescibacteria group bacterium]|jgi:hypothetical protein